MLQLGRSAPRVAYAMSVSAMTGGTGDNIRQAWAMESMSRFTCRCAVTNSQDSTVKMN